MVYERNWWIHSEQGLLGSVRIAIVPKKHTIDQPNLLHFWKSWKSGPWGWIFLLIYVCFLKCLFFVPVIKTSKMEASLEKLLQDDGSYFLLFRNNYRRRKRKLICFIISETFKQFLDENFDDRSYANNIIQGRAISDSLARLADGINLLDKELHSQVCCFVLIKLI